MYGRSLSTVLAVALAAASLALSAAPASAASTYWVATNGSGSACTSAAPCGSFEAALGVARPGDTVRVRAGTYGLQEIDRNVNWDGDDANIVFRPASGAVNVGGIRSHVPSLTFRDFNVTGVMYFHAGADANEARSNRINQAYVTSADDTRWMYNVIDPTTDGPDAMQVKGVEGDQPVGVTIIGNILGPQLLDGDSHTDCLQILGGDDIYVARNIFFPCADKSIQIRSGAGGTIGSVVIEANFLSQCNGYHPRCNGYHAVIVAAEGNDIRFIHNSVNGSIAFSESGSEPGGADSVRFYGNIADSLPCTPHSDYNLVDSAKCGSHDITGRPSWVDRDELVQNLHLVAGSRGIGAGSPYVPTYDIDGESNCAGGDLGADQTCGSAASGGGSAEMADAVAWLYDADVTTEGPSISAFRPNDTSSRAETVTFLYRAFGEPGDRAGRPSDVPARQWYSVPVRWAVAVDIVTGYPDGTFRPFNNITRGDFAVMLWRAAGEPSVAVVALPDVAVDRYYAQAIAWAKKVGVMNGFNDGTFRPDDAIVRGHAALMLCRFSNEVTLAVGSCG